MSRHLCFCTYCAVFDWRTTASFHWSPAAALVSPKWTRSLKSGVLFVYTFDCCYITSNMYYLYVPACPLLYGGAPAARTPGVNHLPAWHKMPGWWWQRTYAQSEEVWLCFKVLPEALGLHTGKYRTRDLHQHDAPPSLNHRSIGWWSVCKSVQPTVLFVHVLSQNGPIISRDTGRCLEVEMSKDANFGLRLVVQRCSGQKWIIRNWIKHPRHWSKRKTLQKTVNTAFQVAVGCRSADGRERSSNRWTPVGCISHYRLHCTPSFPQAAEAFPHSDLKKNMIYSCSPRRLYSSQQFEVAHFSDIQLLV